MKLLVICGPTATGKTKVALELAKKYNGEIVSCDSRQVYIGMDIGTGKDVKKSEKQASSINTHFKNVQFKLHPYLHEGINLWMYDVVFPNQEYSIFHHSSLSKVVIQDIVGRGKLPIIVGGSGLYIKAVTEDVPTVTIPQDKSLRTELSLLSTIELQQKLESLSPQVWEDLNNSDKNNPRRLIRKIEIALSPKKLEQNNDLSNKNQILTIGLKVPTEEIKRSIDSRVNLRLEAGLINEIRVLISQGYSWNLPALNTFGYKEWQTYLTTGNESDKNTAIENWIQNEVNYVKKQMTWFKKQPEINWVDATQENLLANINRLVDLWYTIGIKS